MQVNSKITLDAPQESLGSLSRPSAAQGENNFSAVLEAKTTPPQRQAGASKSAHASKAASAGVSRAEVKPQEPGGGSAANKPRAETKSKSAAVVDAASSPRTDAKSQDKAAASAASTAATNAASSSAPNTVETDPDVLSEQERALISNPNMQGNKALDIAGTDASVWRDVDAAAEEAVEVMDPALLSSECLTSDFLRDDTGSDHVKIAGDCLPPEAQSTFDTSLDSEAAAIDFLQHLQNSLATNTQVVIPRANLQEPDLAAQMGTDPTASGDPVTSNTESSGKFLPPSEVAASSSDALSSAESKLTEEGFSQWLDELTLPAEPVSSPSEPPASSDLAAMKAESEAKSGVQASAAAAVKGQQAGSGTDANTKALGPQPERGEHASELTQLAALLAGGGKREGASRATAVVSETAASALVRAPLETTAEPTTELAFSLNSILSPQTSKTPQASTEESFRDELSLQVNVQPEGVRSASAGSSSEMHGLLGGTQGAVTQAAATSAATSSAVAAQEALSRSRETPLSLAAVHLGLPQQAAPELAARMTLMMGQKWHEAEIQLEPQGLGKISIQLSIDQDQKANVQFIVQHGSSRELLEQALPKLRDMLASQGIQLGQTNVQQQSAGQQQDQGQFAQQSQGQGNGSSSPWRRGENSLGESVDVQNLVIHSTDASGIDFYA